MTDRAWFSRLLRHPARKRSRSILTTLEPARGSEWCDTSGCELWTISQQFPFIQTVL